MLRQRFTLYKRLYLPLSIAVGTIILGTLGFWLIWRPEEATWLDAFYMTAITVMTIGYGEVYPLNSIGRVWAITVAFFGAATFAYSLTVIMDFMVEQRFADFKGDTMQQTVRQLRDHVILVGFGKIAQQTALDLQAARVPFVIVDLDTHLREVAEDHEMLWSIADPTQDEVLEKLNIHHARGLIVATENEATNLYVVLSARVLNATLHIVSLALHEESVPKLIRAGANRTISSATIVGRRLARLMLSPSIVDFFDTVFEESHKGVEN
ncbi:MAG: potassium channel family protein [Trueperaceae bacterium]